MPLYVCALLSSISRRSNFNLVPTYYVLWPTTTQEVVFSSLSADRAQVYASRPLIARAIYNFLDHENQISKEATRCLRRTPKASFCTIFWGPGTKTESSQELHFLSYRRSRNCSGSACALLAQQSLATDASFGLPHDQSIYVPSHTSYSECMYGTAYQKWFRKNSMVPRCQNIVEESPIQRVSTSRTVSAATVSWSVTGRGKDVRAICWCRSQMDNL